MVFTRALGGKFLSLLPWFLLDEAQLLFTARQSICTLRKQWTVSEGEALHIGIITSLYELYEVLLLHTVNGIWLQFENSYNMWAYREENL